MTGSVVTQIMHVQMAGLVLYMNMYMYMYMYMYMCSLRVSHTHTHTLPASPSPAQGQGHQVGVCLCSTYEREETHHTKLVLYHSGWNRDCGCEGGRERRERGMEEGRKGEEARRDGGIEVEGGREGGKKGWGKEGREGGREGTMTKLCPAITTVIGYWAGCFSWQWLLEVRLEQLVPA